MTTANQTQTSSQSERQGLTPLNQAFHTHTSYKPSIRCCQMHRGPQLCLNFWYFFFSLGQVCLLWKRDLFCRVDSYLIFMKRCYSDLLWWFCLCFSLLRLHHICCCSSNESPGDLQCRWNYNFRVFYIWRARELLHLLQAISGRSSNMHPHSLCWRFNTNLLWRLQEWWKIDSCKEQELFCFNYKRIKAIRYWNLLLWYPWLWSCSF